MLSSKRIISLVISCLFVVQILTSTLLNSSQVGAASSSEGYEILGSIENLQEEESKESTRIGDVDGNGEVNSIDFAFMRQYMLGIIKKFPAENKVTPTPSISAIPSPSISAVPTPSNSTVPTPTDVGPSKPTGLEYSLISGTSVLVSWEPSTDDVKNYAVFKNGNYEARINEEEYTFTNLIPGETYEFKVCAIDEEHEQSEFSEICVVKTNVSTMDEMKIALINNLDNRGINYTLTYKGEFEEFKTKISQVVEVIARFKITDDETLMFQSTTVTLFAEFGAQYIKKL